MLRQRDTTSQLAKTFLDALLTVEALTLSAPKWSQKSIDPLGGSQHEEVRPQPVVPGELPRSDSVPQSDPKGRNSPWMFFG